MEIRIRKKIVKNIEPFEPPEDKYGIILTINDEEVGPIWYKDFQRDEEAVYSRWGIRHTYEGQPVYIYLTSEKAIAADARVGSDEDFERIRESNAMDIDDGTPLINLRKYNNSIDKDELIELGIFERVPRILKYITKTEYETIESLFED